MEELHREAETCPTCLWLAAHDAYKTKFLCEKEECADCLQVHLDLPLFWLKSLRSLKGSGDEYSATISLELRDYSSYNSSCVLKYAHKYLARLLRDGDCLSIYGRRDKNKIIMVYYQGEFSSYSYKVPSSPGNVNALPVAIDIAEFGRADYFSRSIPNWLTVRCRFLGYRSKILQLDERLGYALWKVSKPFDRKKVSGLEHKLLPEMVEIILGYLRDVWYIFSNSEEIIPENWKTYSYRHYSGHLSCVEMDRLKESIPDKTKILYTILYNSGFQTIG